MRGNLSVFLLRALRLDVLRVAFVFVGASALFFSISVVWEYMRLRNIVEEQRTGAWAIGRSALGNVSRPWDDGSAITSTVAGIALARFAGTPVPGLLGDGDRPPTDADVPVDNELENALANIWEDQHGYYVSVSGVALAPGGLMTHGLIQSRSPIKLAGYDLLSTASAAISAGKSRVVHIDQTRISMSVRPLYNESWVSITESERMKRFWGFAVAIHQVDLYDLANSGASLFESSKMAGVVQISDAFIALTTTETPEAIIQQGVRVSYSEADFSVYVLPVGGFRRFQVTDVARTVLFSVGTALFLLLVLAVLYVFLAQLQGGTGEEGSELPGTVPTKAPFAVVATEIHDATRAWSSAPRTMSAVLKETNAKLRAIAVEVSGVEPQLIADGALIVGRNINDALDIAFAIQRWILQKSWPDDVLRCFSSDAESLTEHSSREHDFDEAPIKMRIAIHWCTRIKIRLRYSERPGVERSCSSEGRKPELSGPDCRIVASLCAAAPPGEIIASGAAAALFCLDQSRVEPLSALDESDFSFGSFRDPAVAWLGQRIVEGEVVDAHLVRSCRFQKSDVATLKRKWDEQNTLSCKEMTLRGGDSRLSSKSTSAAAGGWGDAAARSSDGFPPHQPKTGNKEGSVSHFFRQSTAPATRVSLPTWMVGSRGSPSASGMPCEENVDHRVQSRFNRESRVAGGHSGSAAPTKHVVGSQRSQTRDPTRLNSTSRQPGTSGGWEAALGVSSAGRMPLDASSFAASLPISVPMGRQALSNIAEENRLTRKLLDPAAMYENVDAVWLPSRACDASTATRMIKVADLYASSVDPVDLPVVLSLATYFVRALSTALSPLAGAEQRSMHRRLQGIFGIPEKNFLPHLALRCAVIGWRQHVERFATEQTFDDSAHATSIF